MMLSIVRHMGTKSFAPSFQATLNGISRLNRMVNEDVERRKKKGAHKHQARIPKAVHFEASTKMKHFNAQFILNLNLLKSSPMLKDLVGKTSLIFTEAQVSPKFDEVFVLWRTTVIQNQDCLSEVQQTLNTLAPDIRHELNLLQIMGSIPKLTFIQGMCAIMDWLTMH